MAESKPDLQRASEYAQRHNLHGLFERLLQELIVHKPDNPIDFLIKTLQTPPKPRIVISGAPASGKGTQCELIVKRFGVVHISTGDVLREQVKQGTPLGKQAQGYMSRGELVPDDLIIGMVKEKLTTEECRTKGWLLDGFPRTQPQAQAMLAAGIIPDKFILLDVPDDVLIERVVGRRLDPQTNAIYHLKFSPPPADVASRCIQREDDTEEKARVRLSFYHSNLAAIRSSFAYCERVVDGNRPKEAVFKDIEAFITQ